MPLSSILSSLEITNLVLLLVSFTAIATLFIGTWFQRGHWQLTRLFWLSLIIVSSAALIHVVGNVISTFQLIQIPIEWAIAIYAALNSTMVILLICLIPIVDNLLGRFHAYNLQQIKKNLRREMVERQAATVALQDSEDRFRSIFDHAAIGIAIINRESKILNANPVYYQIFGHPEASTAELFLDQQTHPEDLLEYQTAIAQLFSKEYSTLQRTKRYLDKKGQQIWVNLTLSLVEPESVNADPYAIAMIENISQRKQAEAELIQAQERLQELLQARTDQVLQMNEELSWQASHDHLTGLLNRYAFELYLTRTLTNSRKHNTSEHTLCYLNLDHFKVINELGGSLAGDEVLRQVSRIIESRCRQTDMIARLAADEFALLLHQCSLEQSGKIAQSIVEIIQSTLFHWQDQEYTLSASIGLVSINHHSKNCSEIMMAADAACDAAKRRGRSRIHVYESDDQELRQYRSEAQWIAKIEEALKHDHFVLYGQSIVPMQQGQDHKTAHCEILIRLMAENGEVVSPGLFLPAAERYHLITKIDYWVIKNTLHYVAQQLLNGCAIVVYSINLSGASINDESLLAFLHQQFKKYAVPTHLICFEVTETVAIANLQRATEVIQSIRAMGCRIALDDFGSGMSSFSYLKYLPVDYLKIDGSFIKDIVDDPIDCAMVEAMNRIGHVMGIETVAEYVSNDAIIEKIRHIGIDYGQGYGLGKPTQLL